MKAFLEKLCLLAVLSVFFLNGCSANSADQNKSNRADSSQNSNSGNTNSVKDEMENFRQIVRLPFEPYEVVWLEENGNSENSVNSANFKQKLIAVMRFQPPDSEKITAQASANRAGTPAIVETESWFPAELIAQSQISGDETVRGTTYPANDFMQAPYTEGKLTRVENSDYFVLELTAR